MMKWRLSILAMVACGSLLGACGEVRYIDACKDSESAEACSSCCDEHGYLDWSYNADYSPRCGCIE